jgi:Domain of unknown function (DUF3806)
MQKITDLSADMIKYIEAKRNWVRNHFTAETIKEYDTIKGKLNLLDVILKSDWIEKQETIKLQSLGITLGDIIVQDMGFIWIQVEDENGTDPALLLPDTSMKLFPLTMLSKRIEKGESIDIYEFYGAIKEKVNEIKSQA